MKNQDKKSEPQLSGLFCPSCQSQCVWEGGDLLCPDCGEQFTDDEEEQLNLVAAQRY